MTKGNAPIADTATQASATMMNPSRAKIICVRGRAIIVAAVPSDSAIADVARNAHIGRLSPYSRDTIAGSSRSAASSRMISPTILSTILRFIVLSSLHALR